MKSVDLKKYILDLPQDKIAWLFVIIYSLRAPTYYLIGFINAGYSWWYTAEILRIIYWTFSYFLAGIMMILILILLGWLLSLILKLIKKNVELKKIINLTFFSSLIYTIPITVYSVYLEILPYFTGRNVDFQIMHFKVFPLVDQFTTILWLVLFLYGLIITIKNQKRV